MQLPMQACEKHTRHQEDIGSYQNVSVKPPGIFLAENLEARHALPYTYTSGRLAPSRTACSSCAYEMPGISTQVCIKLQVTIVAKILSVKDASSGAMMKMVVYDGTGSFNVEHYMPQDDEQVPTSLCLQACMPADEERCSMQCSLFVAVPLKRCLIGQMHTGDGCACRPCRG